MEDPARPLALDHVPVPLLLVQGTMVTAANALAGQILRVDAPLVEPVPIISLFESGSEAALARLCGSAREHAVARLVARSASDGRPVELSAQVADRGLVVAALRDVSQERLLMSLVEGADRSSADGAPTQGPTTEGVTTEGVTTEGVTTEVGALEVTERLTHMLDATTDYVAVFRPDGEILYVNRTTSQALGRLREAGRDGTLGDLVDSRQREKLLRDVLDGVEGTGIWRGELTLDVGVGRDVHISALGVVRRSDSGDVDWIAMLGRDISEVKKVEARLRRLATRDPLTGLANRSLANDRLEHAVARHRRADQGIAVLFCDLDGFKPINDAHGHGVGDGVLVAIANRLSSVTRAPDTVARVGGDEFVVIVEGVDEADELAGLSERIIKAVTAPLAVASTDVSLGISVGVSFAGPGTVTLDADRMLTIADSTMYLAKADGGNRYRITRVGAPG